MNEWLRRRAEKDRGQSLWWDKTWTSEPVDIKELQKAMSVTLWVDAVDGRHQLPFDALPFEGVISFSFVEEAVVSGFSIWLHGQELVWQRLGFQGLKIPKGGRLDILTKSLHMELLPLALS
jgi:hypothetical protein